MAHRIGHYEEMCGRYSLLQAEALHHPRERLSKGKRENASEGGYIGGWLPYGYARDGNAVVVVKEEAEVIEQIFRWKTEDKTLQWICDRLNGDGIKTKRGGKWQVSTIRAKHDAIVSDVLFGKCNDE